MIKRGTERREIVVNGRLRRRGCREVGLSDKHCLLPTLGGIICIALHVISTPYSCAMQWSIYVRWSSYVITDEEEDRAGIESIGWP